MRGISASWLCFGDGETPPLAHGAVVLDAQERVVAIAALAELRAQHADVAFAHHEAVITPGFVNAHTHLELSALRGEVPGGRGFVPWVDALIPARERLQPEANLEAIDDAVSASLAAGVVAIGDISNRLSSVDALGSAPVLARVFHEVFGMRRDTGEAMLAMARRARAERTSWPRNVSYVLAPHTPYTMHPDVLREVLRLARASGARTSLHLAEHAAERAFLESASGPIPPWLAARNTTALDWEVPRVSSVAYAAQLGALAPDVIAVHLADARHDEVLQVAKAGAPVVLCPRSNLHIELKLPPLLEILGAGIRPGLGTDSLASNASLDPLAEARSLHQRFPTVPARTLLAMVCGYGADVLGFERTLGRLRVGLAPGLVAFPHEGPGPQDPERWVLHNDRVGRSVVSRPAFSSLITEALA